jgi:hypothetical protein
MPKFDAKSFNPQAFKYRADRIPRTRLNEMRKSRVLTGNPDIRAVFTTQDGTGYARIAMRGLLDGDAVNYDGQTDITATSTKTFEQGVVVVGRAKAWVEKDFSHDITGGIDFMDNVAQQVTEYWQDVDQDTLLAILKGIFSMTSTKGAEFVKKHTFEVDGPMEATTLNSATAQACGDRKKKFSMIFMCRTKPPVPLISTALAVLFCYFPFISSLSQLQHILDKALHADGAVLFHPVCEVAVSVQGKGCGGVAQIALYRLYIIPGPDSIDGVCMPEIVKADTLQASGSKEL